MPETHGLPPTLPLSVLEALAPVGVRGSTPGPGPWPVAVDLARLAERLGYRRLWVARASQHMPRDRELVAPRSSSRTSRASTSTIRGGPRAGVMLPNHASLVGRRAVSGMLEALHPGTHRSRSGPRHPAPIPVTAAAVCGAVARSLRRPTSSPSKLTRSVSSSSTVAHPQITAGAGTRLTAPAVWMLGPRATFSAQAGCGAATSGCRSRFAHHFRVAQHDLPAPPDLSGFVPSPQPSSTIPTR